MKAQEFVKTYQPKFSEYCPCVIDTKGEIYMCEKSHLDALIQLSGDDQILNKIPKEASPLFYLTEQLSCVVVDYENQVYYGELTWEQSEALLLMSDAQIILMKPKNIRRE